MTTKDKWLSGKPEQELLKFGDMIEPAFSAEEIEWKKKMEDDAHKLVNYFVNLDGNDQKFIKEIVDDIWENGSYGNTPKTRQKIKGERISLHFMVSMLIGLSQHELLKFKNVVDDTIKTKAQLTGNLNRESEKEVPAENVNGKGKEKNDEDLKKLLIEFDKLDTNQQLIIREVIHDIQYRDHYGRREIAKKIQNGEGKRLAYALESVSPYVLFDFMKIVDEKTKILEDFGNTIEFDFSKGKK